MRKLMAYGSVAVLALAIFAYKERAGDEIKIFAPERDVQAVVDQMNYMVPQESITFRLVRSESEADIYIRFKDKLEVSGADAVSFTHRGQIYIANTAPVESLPAIFLHEILHCAGVGHEENASSVMYAYTQKHGKISTQQIRDLQRLSGITTPERWIAQLRLLL